MLQRCKILGRTISFTLRYIQKKKKNIDLYICSQHELFSVCLLDSVDPGQTGPSGAV